MCARLGASWHRSLDLLQAAAAARPAWGARQLPVCLPRRPCQLAARPVCSNLLPLSSLLLRPFQTLSHPYPSHYHHTPRALQANYPWQLLPLLCPSAPRPPTDLSSLVQRPLNAADALISPASVASLSATSHRRPSHRHHGCLWSMTTTVAMAVSHSRRSAALVSCRWLPRTLPPSPPTHPPLPRR